MAETSSRNTTPRSASAKPSAKRAGTRSSAAARKPAARRSTTRAAAGAPSPARASRSRTTAVNETREAAQANARAARVTAAQTRGLAQRATLAGVGVTLEARDRAAGLASDLVNRYGSILAAERDLGKARRDLGRDFKRFERRGTTARTQVERDVKKARTRLERELRTRRRDVERLVRRETQAVERDAQRRPNVVTQQLSTVSGRVEDAVQVGVAVGSRIVKEARGQLAVLA